MRPESHHDPAIPGSNPSACRVGEDYLVCSGFEYFPGVPLFHSRCLSTEIATGLAGRVVGMYVTEGVAAFDWFDHSH